MCNTEFKFSKYQLEFLNEQGNPELELIEDKTDQECDICFFGDIDVKVSVSPCKMEDGSKSVCHNSKDSLHNNIFILKNKEESEEEIINISKTNLRKILDDVMGLGIYTRNCQLRGQYTGSDVKVLDAYIKKHDVFGENNEL